MALVPIAGLALIIGACAPQLMLTPNICVDAEKNPWEDVPTTLRTPEVNVIFATDRKAENGDDQPVRYGSKRSEALTFGVCPVAIGDDWSTLVDESTRPTRRRAIPLEVGAAKVRGAFPATPWKVDDAQADKTAALAELQQQFDGAQESFRELVAQRLDESPHKDVYVFVHGFNYSFEDAARVMAGLWHFLGRRGVPVIYSWPAGSGLSSRGYNYDRESGEFTLYHLKDFLRALAGTPNLGKVHVIAHSRGADVVVSALRELNVYYDAKNPQDEKPAATALRIGYLVLAAPDIDWEVAQQRLEAERINRACERITIYASPDDLAMAIVRYLFDSTIRLGTLGLLKLPRQARGNLARLVDVDVIDARVSDGLVGHDYFYNNPAVSSDLILLLRDRRQPGAEHGRPLIKQPNGYWELHDGYPKQVSD
ncbi:MAG TPA: alpha/beta fold hydrolase [Phycisphaerae bacterium]|nr:alpha/beta fold hydrolase [Phycisphaerae bacterium]